VSTVSDASDFNQAPDDGSPGEPESVLDRTLAFVPRVLSSHAHIIFLACLGVFLVVLPLVGVNVSARAELIGGNYTNVTSDLGACIAAGLTVHLVKRDRRRSREMQEMFAHLHRRHDALTDAVNRAAAAAERAEAAANRS
jgi:hypothetical protein